MRRFGKRQYWKTKRGRERFKIFKVKNSVPVRLFVGDSNKSLGIEIGGLISLFLGNFEKKQLEEIEEQARELGFREEKRKRETLRDEAGILNKMEDWEQ